MVKGFNNIIGMAMDSKTRVYIRLHTNGRLQMEGDIIMYGGIIKD